MPQLMFFVLIVNSLCREVTQNEFIVPLSNDLKELYSEAAMGNSMSATQTESVRPVMVMSDIQ